MKRICLLFLLFFYGFNAAFAQINIPSNGVFIPKPAKPLPSFIPTSGLRVTVEILNRASWGLKMRDANGNDLPLNYFKFRVYKTNIVNVNNGFVKTHYNHTEVSGFNVYQIPESTTVKRFADGKEYYSFIISGLQKGQIYSIDLEAFGHAANPNGLKALIPEFGKIGHAVPSDNTAQCAYSVVDGSSILLTVSEKKITIPR